MRPFNAAGELQQAIPTAGAGLRRLAVRGVGATLLSGGMGLAIQIVSAAVLARILAPRDFGLVTMVTTFSLLFLNFGLNGFTEAICHREDINHGLASNLFWINVIGSSVLAAVFAAGGGVLVKIFGDPRVAEVARWMSLTIVLTGLSVIHLALLRRTMRFSVVSANDMVARGVSVVVSICLGWMGWGYWALVAGAITLAASTCIGAWILCRWMPSLPRRVPGTGAMIGFAVNAYGRFSTGYFTNNLDNFLVGWKLGPTELGFYKKAYDLFGVPSNQLSSGLTVVAVSALSRLQKDAVQYRKYLISALGVMAFIGMAISGGLTLGGSALIRVLLGAKWGDSGQLFTIFAPGIGFMLLYFTHVWIHLSLGRPDRWLRWGFVDLAATTIFLLIGLHWKAQGIAAAWVVSYWVLALPALWYASKPIGLGISEVVGVIWQYVVAALVSGASGYLLIKAIPALRMKPGLAGAITHLSEVSVLFLVFYLLGVIVLHRGLAPIYQVMSLVREMTARVGREPSPGEKAADWRMEDRGRQGWPSDAAAPLVSILIPAYNAREWIGDTLRSALAQTWPNIEIIVVDDGSTDDTAAVAQEFEGQCVKVVTQKNQGAAAARNTAYSQCHGDYIQWLDADDLLAPDKIERQMEVLGPNGSKSLLLSGAWGKFMYRFRHAKFDPTGLWCDLAPAEWLHRKLEQNIYMQTATWLVSRELTEAAGPWDPRLLGDDDGEYFCRVLMASEGTRFVRASQVYYRSFGYDSLGYVGLSMRKCEAHWLSMQLHIKYLRSLEDTPRSRAACMQYLRNCLIYFYPEKSAIVEQTEAIARELGDRLGEPILSWKYVWLKDLFGWEFAKEVQVAMRKVRWRVARKLDGMLFKTEMLQEQPAQTVRRVRMQRDRVPI